jgi:hypothetical protein
MNTFVFDVTEEAKEQIRKKKREKEEADKQISVIGTCITLMGITDISNRYMYNINGYNRYQ